MFIRRFLLGAILLAPSLLAATVEPVAAPAGPLSAAEPATPVPPPASRIYLAPDDHTDYMWAGNEADYRQAFLDMIDYYLGQADLTENEPADFRSRWNCDGSMWIHTYEQYRTPEQFDRLVKRIKEGYVSFPLNYLVSTYGGMPTEAVLRGMYYSGYLQRRYGLHSPMAIAMENQTLPYGLGGLWAGSGAKYSWRGICACGTKLPNDPRPHEIYWWPADDGSRILMKWFSNRGRSGLQHLGRYAEARRPIEMVEFAEKDEVFRRAHPYSVVGIFGQGSDDLKTLDDKIVRAARATSRPDRRVIVSNMTDFFEDFEYTHGAELPQHAASFGNEWDLYPMSMAEVTASVRRAVEKLRPAEALATVAQSREPNFMKPLTAARDRAWVGLGLYWEHNWTSEANWVPTPDRADWQRRVASDVIRYVDRLQNDAARALGRMIPSEGANRFAVFNPLGWTRTDAADLPYTGEAAVHVVDVATGREVPSQVVSFPDVATKQTGRWLRILAEELPPVGYKVYEIRPGVGREWELAAEVADFHRAIADKGAFPATGREHSLVLENSEYRLRVLGNGSITSLVDKQLGERELSAKELNFIRRYPGQLEVENAGPVSVTVKATSRGPLPHVTRITLYRNSRRIDIRNDITATFDGTHAWSFAWKMENPDVHHEEIGAVIRAKLLADGGQYSPVLSRLEWLSLNHFVDMTGTDGFGVTLSNADSSFMKLGDSTIVDGVSRLDTKSAKFAVMAGGQIDGPTLGIPFQDGDSHFIQRFGLRVHQKYDATDAMRFSLEHQNPPVAFPVTGERPSLPRDRYSHFSLSDPRLVLWALKPAEDAATGDVVARVWNLDAEAKTYRPTLTAGAPTARAITHIETDLAEGGVATESVTVRGKQLQTIVLKAATSAP